ncbi:transposase, mutator type [Artemisia annua]|uniref:Transposase, mutator type n=1 Tax=Artemisia annua TaxID=35608 RepID=A0A2U1MW71_ARTAN|nr:transposase, mutator type [Artemisia annua]
MNARTYPCKKWELIGMLYMHAVASIWNMANHNLEPGLPESWQEMYRFKINPCNSSKMWKPSDSLIILAPPKYRTPVMGHNQRSCKGQRGSQATGSALPSQEGTQPSHRTSQASVSPSQVSQAQVAATAMPSK